MSGNNDDTSEGANQGGDGSQPIFDPTLQPTEIGVDAAGINVPDDPALSQTPVAKTPPPVHVNASPKANSVPSTAVPPPKAGQEQVVQGAAPTGQQAQAGEPLSEPPVSPPFVSQSSSSSSTVPKASPFATVPPPGFTADPSAGSPPSLGSRVRTI